MKFTVDGIPKTMNYDVLLRYAPQQRGDWEDVRVSLIRPDGVAEDSGCFNLNPLDEQERSLRLNDYDTKTIALSDLCLEEGKTYTFVFSFNRQSPYEPNPKAQILIDSVRNLLNFGIILQSLPINYFFQLTLIPRIEVTSIFAGSSSATSRHQEFEQNRCNESYYDIDVDPSLPQCQELVNMAATLVFNGATRKYQLTTMLQFKFLSYHKISNSLGKLDSWLDIKKMKSFCKFFLAIIFLEIFLQMLLVQSRPDAECEYTFGH